MEKQNLTLSAVIDLSTFAAVLLMLAVIPLGGHVMSCLKRAVQPEMIDTPKAGVVAWRIEKLPDGSRVVRAVR